MTSTMQRSTLWAITALGMAAPILIAAFTWQPIALADEAKQQGPPPLVVDLESPLLLDEPEDGEPAAKTDKADNSACFVCHANYQEEPLANWHAEEKIACVDCHGDSFAHRNDENNTTPPDVMFPAAKIDKACSECHDMHDVAATEVIARLLERCPEKARSGQLVCTDCHGQHRLKLRTVVWDKATGKLLTGAQRKKQPAVKDKQ